jgi:hypothetical protein
MTAGGGVVVQPYDRLASAAAEVNGDGVPASTRDDALRYFHDVAVSLTALVRVYPPAAGLLCSGALTAVQDVNIVDGGKHTAGDGRNTGGATMGGGAAGVGKGKGMVGTGPVIVEAKPGTLLEVVSRIARETVPLLSGEGGRSGGRPLNPKP